jgi:hypothetical protein
MENVPVEKKSKRSPWTKVWISLGVLLFVIVGVSVYEYFRIAPNNVYFTNVTSNSVTVSWNTKRATSSSVLATEGEKRIPVAVVLKGERYFDTRDVTNAELNATEQTSENISEDDSLVAKMDNFQTEVVVTDRGKYYTHHVTVTNLDPETEYSFLVGDRYIYRSVTDVNDLSVAKTLEIPDSVKSPVPAYGSVKDANNQEDLTVDELIPVSDGVIYLNYFDTITNQRSNIFSSVLNKDGNWYIDLSLAIDSEGSPFMDTYDTIDGNIKVEYILDSGSMGIWEKTQDAYTLTPAQDIVLNIPNVVQDANVEGSLILLNDPLADSNVKGVTIMSFFTPPSSEEGSSCSCRCPSGSSTLKPSGSYTTLVGQCTDSSSECVAPTCYKPKTSTTNNTTDTNTNNSTETNTTTQEQCLFTEFCPKNVNDCVTEITRKRCKCPQEKLDERNCSTGGEPVPEDLTCAGGYKQGAPAYDGTKCVVCGYTTNNNYFLARWEDSNGSYQYIDGVCTPVGTPTCGVANGKIYSSDTYTILHDDLCVLGFVSSLKPVKFSPESNIATWECQLNDDSVSCSATKQSNAEVNTKTCFKIANKKCEDFLYRYDGENPNCGSYYSSSSECEGVLNDWNGGFGPVQGDSCYINGVDNAVYNSQLECVEVGSICAISGRTTRAWTSEGTCGGVKTIVQGDSCYIKGVDNAVYNSQLECVEVGSICAISGRTKWLWNNEGDCSGWNQIGARETTITPVSISPVFYAIVHRINAQNQQYLIDYDNNIFLNLAEGVYVFEYQGQEYTFTTSGQNKVMIYIDTDKDSVYTENIDIQVSDIASEINIIALEQRYDYELTTGFNFVSFPFLISNEEYRTAAGLLQKLNEVYDDSIYSISTFDGGKWKMVGQNVEVYDNNDFQLLPGVGYMIKAKEDINISIVGQPIQYESESDSAPITLFSGWNLIGIYGTNVKSYTAKTLIQNINADDFTADNVTKWAKDKQMYEGFQLSDGEEYGFDFPINKLESYFVRITQGSGNWQPGLSSNN